MSLSGLAPDASAMLLSAKCVSAGNANNEFVNEPSIAGQYTYKVTYPCAFLTPPLSPLQ